VGSVEARTRLLKASLELTLLNPLLGVGPGQFSPAENDMAVEAGARRGSWQVTHNSYTEVSSEAGIPALLFFVGSMFFSFKGLSRIYRRTKGTPHNMVRNAAFCLMLSLVGFSVSILFSSMAYRYYLPSLIGIAAVFITAATRELQQAENQPRVIR
jgi:O-antigen ligase